MLSYELLFSVLFHSFVATGMAPQTIGEPTRSVNAGRLGPEATNQLIVLQQGAELSFFTAPVAITAGCGAGRAKDQIAMRIGQGRIGVLSKNAGAIIRSYETAYEKRATDHQDRTTHRASVSTATYFGMPIWGELHLFVQLIAFFVISQLVQ